MRDAVERAQGLFEAGLPLVRTLNRRLALDIDLFQRGGLRVLDKIRAQDYDVLSHRPAIARSERMRLLAGSLWRVALMRTL
jgi:phytoene/squalene synthetase